MMRLHTPDDDLERSTNELADWYSRPRTPKREHPDSYGTQPPNVRNGQLTGSEYELIELACTMPARQAFQNLEYCRGGMPSWQETGPLPVLPIAHATRMEAAPEISEWIEATPEEMGRRASLGMTLLLCITTWAVLFFLLARV